MTNENWIKKCVIEVSSLEYSIPIVLIKKNGGEYRLCIDYTMISKIIAKERYPLLLMEDILDKLQNTTIFSSFIELIFFFSQM